MKIMKKIVLFLFVLIFATSCDMTEKVYLDEKGEVKYALSFDMNTMGSMMGQSEKNKDNFPMDTIMTLDQLENSDSKFAESFGKGMSEEEELKELMKDYKFHLKFTEEESFMSMFLDKKSIKDFNKEMKVFDKKFQNLLERKRQENEVLPDSLKSKNDFDLPFYSSLHFDYNGKTFKREGELKKTTKDDTKDDSGESGFDELESMISKMMTYKLEYHFPRPVKTISDTTVLMSWDRKTIYLEKPIQFVLDNPTAYNFEATLED